MEAPKTPKDSSTPKLQMTRTKSSRRRLEDIGETEAGEPLPPSVVQLVPLQAQQSNTPPAYPEITDPEDMRDRPLYSPSFNPDDLFAFPFPYVPPLSHEAIDKRLRTARGDAYQRLFRDLVRPVQAEYEDENVPCGSCPCCQRMLSYVSSLRTVLDHMVSDIVQKSPAGTKVAPCALCLQEHRDHFTHQEQVASSQTPASEKSSLHPADESTPVLRRPGPRRSQSGDQNIRRKSQDQSHYVPELQSKDDIAQTSVGQAGDRPSPAGQPLIKDHRLRHYQKDQFEESKRPEDSSPLVRTQDQHGDKAEPPSEFGRDSESKDGTTSELTDQGSPLRSTDMDNADESAEVTQRPASFKQPYTQDQENSYPSTTTDLKPTDDDERWKEARSQLLEPPQFSPRDNHSPVISHGGQYIHENVVSDPNRPPNEAYVTMATDNLTALCCLVLGNSIRLTDTNRKLAVIVTDGVTGLLRHHLQCVFDVVQSVGVMDSQGSTKLALLDQPELGVSFTKLYVWSLDQFSKCIFLESDTLVVQNCDELFDREELSAVPDIGWPDCFNSGVFVFGPSQETFWKLIHFAEQQDSFDGGDQGLLNIFFQNWACNISRKLPFLYNLMANVSYTYKPAFKHFGSRVKIVHFFGSYKPWNVQFHPKTGQMAPGSNVHPTYAQFVHFWLEIYTKRVLPIFTKEIQDHMFSQEYACAHEVLQFIPSPVRLQDSLPTPPSFRVYGGDKPRDQLSLVDSILQLGRDAMTDGYESKASTEQSMSDLTFENDNQLQQDLSNEHTDPNTIPGSEMDDYQNMAAWEQGRMDYLGDARSDTIMKRLDFLIKGKR